MKVTKTMLVERDDISIPITISGTISEAKPARFHRSGEVLSPPEWADVTDLEAEHNGQPFELSKDEEVEACEELLN